MRWPVLLTCSAVVAAAALDAFAGAPYLRTILAGIFVLLAPGWLLLRAWDRSAQRSIAEEIGIACAVSWVLLTVVCLAVFLMHGQVWHVIVALAVGQVLLLPRVVRDVRSAITAAGSSFEWLTVAGVVVAALATCVAGGYTNAVEGPAIAPGWSTMEEALQVSTIRKIVGAESLRHDQVMYVKGGFVTYYLPVYPFVLALISFTSRLDPMVMFDTFRFWSASLGLVAFWWLANVAVGRERGARIALAAVALVLLGHAGQAEQLGSWGQLVPLSHIADFALGVLLPMGLAMLTTIAVGRGTWRYAAAVVVFLTAMSTTHIREAPHALSYIAAFLLLSQLVQRGSGRSRLQLAAVGGALLAVVAVYSRFIQANVPFIDYYNAGASSQGLIELLARYWSRGVTMDPTVIPPPQGPVVTLAFLLGPIVLVKCKDRVGLIFLTAGVLAWWLPLYIPVVGYLLQQLTYSEIMMAPSRYIITPAFLLVIAFSFPVTSWLGRSSALRRICGDGGARWVAAIFAPLAIVFGSDALYRVTFGVPAVVLGVGLLLAMLAKSRLWERSSPLWFPDAPAPSRTSVTFTVGAFAIALALQAPKATWFEQGWMRSRPHTANTRQWYERTRLPGLLPWSTVEMLETKIPNGSSIAADPTLGIAIPLVTDQFILFSGSAFTTDLPFLRAWEQFEHTAFDRNRHVAWDDFRKRIGDRLPALVEDEIVRAEAMRYDFTRLVAMAMGPSMRSRPIFGEDTTDQLTMALLAALRPDYLLVDRHRHRRLQQLVQSQPGVFVLAASDGPMSLFKLAR
jgi:hypothetical protein